MVVPRSGRIPLVRDHGYGIRAREAPGLVERVDGHVEEKHVLHAVPEPAEVGAELEVHVDGRDPAQLAGIHERADPAEVRIVPAVLHDRVDDVRLVGGFDEDRRVRHRIRQRLLAENVNTARERGERHRQVRRRHGAVEKDVGLDPVERGGDIGVDDCVAEPALGGELPGGFPVDVHEPDDFEAGDGLRGIDPGPAYPAAPGEQCPQGTGLAQDPTTPSMGLEAEA